MPSHAAEKLALRGARQSTRSMSNSIPVAPEANSYQSRDELQPESAKRKEELTRRPVVTQSMDPAAAAECFDTWSHSRRKYKHR